jgi:cysteine-rich repeat protein
MRPTPRLWIAATCCAWFSCGHDTQFQLPAAQSTSAVARDDDAGPERVAECDGAENGRVCGQAGGHLHCVLNDCVRNACGDGVAAETEECDDGNQRDLDGCDSHCHIEAAPHCGNGKVEPGEACDDGNMNDSDGCSNHCTLRDTATSGAGGRASGNAGSSGTRALGAASTSGSGGVSGSGAS